MSSSPSEKLIRLRLATDPIPLTEPARDAVERWYESVPWSDDAPGAIAFSTSVSLDRGMWRFTGDVESVLEPMGTFFESVGVAPAGFDALREFGERTNPDLVGYWVNARPGIVDAGWHVPGETQVADALELAAPSDVRERLAEWFDDHEIETLSGLERSVGTVGYTGLWFELPGSDPAAKAATAGKLAGELDIDPLTDGVSVILAAHDEATLRGLVWLTEDGVVRFGVAAFDPAAETLIGLSMRVGVDRDDDLAMLQAALGAPRPSFVVAALDADGLGVEVGWEALRTLDEAPA